MNAATKDEATALAEKPTGLALLRAAVPEHLISPLPKGTKAQNECPADQKINCKICGGWHHPHVRHLDYVGHAAATHLLLEADEKWNWEPLAFDPNGLPVLDADGGLWIRLTVCDVTRLGYGNADSKPHMDKGSRTKEIIGDALRNAAMRFGLALELWSKADIHLQPEEEETDTAEAIRRKWLDDQLANIKEAGTVGALRKVMDYAVGQMRAAKDQAGEDELTAAAAAKAAKAKPENRSNA